MLGGVVAPAGLAALALALADRDRSSDVRIGLGWTAAGLYLASRAGILIVIVGNRHISDYNAAMRVRLGLAAAAPGTGGGGLAVAAFGRW